MHPSAEPIPPGNQAELSYRPIHSKAVWGGVYDCAWFQLHGTIPAGAAGKHVVAHINVGGEAVVYEGTEPQSAITLPMNFMDRLQSGVGKTIIEITKQAEANQDVSLYIDAGYNGYYGYPFGWGIFQYADLCVVDDDLLAYYYDYQCIASLLSVTTDKNERTSLEKHLNESYTLHNSSTEKARAILKPLFDAQPDDSAAFTAIGHSHLDLAWLWPVRETKRKAQRTFANQLTNAGRYPNYVYGASQPWQFEYIKNNAPQQYAALQKMAERGQLELQGGMWVEADTNLASGEALIRQIHYGKEFFRNEFGREMKMCWLPDVFGYNGNLPQILKKSGLPYFMTIKLSWNEHNRFPYRSFKWNGIDGSQVLVHMPPGDDYNSDASPACVRYALNNYTERDLAPEGLLVYGIGDGGGGPGEAHIEMVMRQRSLAGSPRVMPGSAIDFFGNLEQYSEKLPSHNGELYLEKHQGTYTTQAANKAFNRRCEYALQDLEALCTLAWQKGRDYPQDQLDVWWKEVLLYQFHDILPGSSITRVYEESRARYATILSEIDAERTKVMSFLSSGKDESAFNPTSFERHEYLCKDDTWFAADPAPYGFAPLKELPPQTGLVFGVDHIENEHIRVQFSDQGEIISAITKKDGAEYAENQLNTLRLYHDKWLFFNAWDIDWKYYKKPSHKLKSYRHETFIDGPTVVRRNYYKHGRTTLTQDVVLYTDRPIIYFKTNCNYHETFKMLRADFDLAINSPFVTCDIQLGSIERSTGDETDVEKAQFEICAHKYVDLSDGKRGASLLNDSKYGHRVKGNRISLNLLRSPIYPDKKADRGSHSFTYALFLHDGGCGTETLMHSYVLNKPLILANGQIDMPSLVRTDSPAVVVETIKRAHSGDGIILRFYESQGISSICSLETTFSFKDAVETDLMENELGSIEINKLDFTPFEIKTIKLK
ncbi:MAG: alpha-mannosidase [Chloroflexi bacterium HGW-Chloroflexi-4]|nr:MAG: alpha-mannosidase [Chloroflexi bacterium HGW-Chloroflexi-4]